MKGIFDMIAAHSHLVRVNSLIVKKEIIIISSSLY